MKRKVIRYIVLTKVISADGPVQSAIPTPISYVQETIIKIDKIMRVDKIIRSFILSRNFEKFSTNQKNYTFFLLIESL